VLAVEVANHELPTEHDTLEIVSTESLECELNLVRAGAAGSLSGILGPQSVTWQVEREAAVFLGAGRALLLQLAHPWVAAVDRAALDTLCGYNCKSLGWACSGASSALAGRRSIP
jgi:hypothetical protein